MRGRDAGGRRRDRRDRRDRQRWRSDRGSGTVLAIGLVLAAAVWLGAVALVTGALAARGAAQAAADLGALAAAEQVAVAGDRAVVTGATATGPAPGAASACAVAAAVVVANHADLTGCELLGGGVVRVTTARDAGIGVARASARAGPAAAR